MRLPFRHGFANLLERSHPRDGQMAVLKQDPLSTYNTSLNLGFGLHTLTLTKGDLLDLFFLALSELLKGIQRIGTRREHKDKWEDGLRVLEDTWQVRLWRLDEVLTDLVAYEIGNGHHKSIGSDAPLEAHVLELVEMLPPA